MFATQGFLKLSHNWQLWQHGFVWKYRIPTRRFVQGVCFGGMLLGLLWGYALGSASHVLHHMELTSYLRGFQQTFQPFASLCISLHAHVYIERETRMVRMVFWSKSTAKHAFKMCHGSGLGVEGLRYETGVIRV